MVAATSQEDTREEPAGGGLRGVGVTAGELAVGLDAAHQSQHGADGVAQRWWRGRNTRS